MTHFHEGMVVALRDELPRDAPTLAHMRVCSTCVAALADAAGRSMLIAEALASLDAPIDLAASKAATRTRLDLARARDRAEAPRRQLGRAAVLLLLATAGAASALTLTPLGRWWSAPAPSSTSAPVYAPAPAVAPAPTQTPESSAVAVDVSAGVIDVVITGAAPGTMLEVVWGTGATARAAGSPGSAFTYGVGRLEVTAAAGDLRLELPRAARSTLRVDGRVYLERSDAGVTVLEPALEHSDDLIRFRVP
jgi:hypothetical protein